jgi:hypothetical protein
MMPNVINEGRKRNLRKSRRGEGKGRRTLIRVYFKRVGEGDPLF